MKQTSTHKKKYHSSIWPFAVALALAACSRNIVYSHYEHIVIDEWDRQDTVHFCVPVASAGVYNVAMGLRVNSLYPYTQLAVRARQTTQKGGHTSTETLCLDITDDEGKVQGEGLNAFYYEAALPPAQLADGATT